MEMILYELLNNTRNNIGSVISYEDIIEHRDFIHCNQNLKGFSGAAAQSHLTGIFYKILNSNQIRTNLIRIKAYDEDLFFHSVNVALLSALIGYYCNLNTLQLKDLFTGALYHDIGKLFISPLILNKKGKLTDYEFMLVKNHVQYGYDYVKYMDFVSNEAMSAIIDHHEQYSGNGYPKGLCCEQISFFGRVVSLADVYDALTSKRSYRPALDHVSALDMIHNSCQKFDPEVLDVFYKDVVVQQP